MNRRIFISALLASGVALLTRSASGSPPRFSLVQAVLKERAKRLPDAQLVLSKTGLPVQSWRGRISEAQPIKLEGAGGVLLLKSGSNTGDIGRQLIVALLSRDNPVEALESAAGPVDTTRTSIEVHGEHTIAYRFGEDPSIVVSRKHWRLLEFQVSHESGSWKAHLSYNEDDHPTLIRVTKEGAARWTARLTYD